MQCDVEGGIWRAEGNEEEGEVSDPYLFVDVQNEHHDESPTAGMTGIVASPSMLVNDSSEASIVRKTHEHELKERRRPIRTMPSVKGETIATNCPIEEKDKLHATSSFVPKVLIGWVVLGRFKLLKELGKGSFGYIYHARDINTQQEVAIKIEKKDIKVPQLKQEANVYKHLRGMQVRASLSGVFEDIPEILIVLFLQGFPRLIAEGEENNLKMIVIDRLGHNIEDLLELCGGRFSLKTVLLLADQMLLRAQFYRDPKTGKHIGQREKNLTSLVGTARYCSINSHHGAQLSRRDDMETIGYVLVYLACRGLPWQGVKATNLPEKYEKIGRIKEQITTAKLCAGLPTCFQRYIDYSRQLAFEEEPDYEMCKEMFRSTFQHCRLKVTSHPSCSQPTCPLPPPCSWPFLLDYAFYQNDRIFDWTGVMDRGSLTVSIIEARNLMGKESGGTSNPYCTLWLSSLGKKRMTSTKVVYSNLNPVWESVFDFVATEPADVLMVEVWSKSGRLSMDKFLGRLQLALANLQNKVRSLAARCSSFLCVGVIVCHAGDQGRVVYAGEEISQVSSFGRAAREAILS
eukprot:633851-Hanusia_phi.AAC.2